MANETKKDYGAWWMPGLKLFSEISTWIAGPVILALVFGKMLDAKFDTKPVILLSFTAVSFPVSIYGIFKVVKKFVNKTKI